MQVLTSTAVIYYFSRFFLLDLNIFLWTMVLVCGFLFYGYGQNFLWQFNTSFAKGTVIIFFLHVNLLMHKYIFSEYKLQTYKCVKFFYV